MVEGHKTEPNNAVASAKYPELIISLVRHPELKVTLSFMVLGKKIKRYRKKLTNPDT